MDKIKKDEPSKVIINPRPPHTPGHRSETACHVEASGPDAAGPAPDSVLDSDGEVAAPGEMKTSEEAE